VLDAVKSVAPSTRLIAVTMLTSLGDEDLPSVGLTPPVGDQVLRLASLTQQCGLDGVVCSAHEIARLRAELGADFQLVVPGIRPKGADIGDQKRVMGPAEAIAAGASQLVIGRPITAAADPALAAREIAQSLGISVS
jgi:orotidine-5'-phosphate decarboxylase